MPPGQVAPPGAPAPRKGRSNVVGALLALAGAVALVAGVFLPWIRTRLEVLSGWDAFIDAKTVLGLAVATAVVGVLLLAGVRHLVLRLLLIVLGVAAVTIAVVDILSVMNDPPEDLNAAIGAGLVVVPIAGVLIVVSGLIARHAPR